MIIILIINVFDIAISLSNKNFPVNNTIIYWINEMVNLDLKN